MIPAPFLLYLGHSTDPLAHQDVARRGRCSGGEDCVGEFRHDDCPLTLGLPRLGMAEAVAAGARTLVLGIAGAGGKLGADLVDDAAAALEAGLNVASGLHQRLRDEPRLAALARGARPAAVRRARSAAGPDGRQGLCRGRATAC